MAVYSGMLSSSLFPCATALLPFSGSSTFLMGKVGEIGFSGGTYDTRKSVSSDIGAW
jgi:hypothetical protein